MMLGHGQQRPHLLGRERGALPDVLQGQGSRQLGHVALHEPLTLGLVEQVAEHGSDVVAGAGGKAFIPQPGEQSADVMGFQFGQLQVAQAGQGVPQKLPVAVEGLGAHPALAEPALPVLGQGRHTTAVEGRPPRPSASRALISLALASCSVAP